MPLKVNLVGLNAELVEAWQRAFEGVAEVTCVRGSIFDYPAEAIVSPANSFGYMDGGLDLLYSETFGWNLESEVRNRILQEHLGELPVGSAVLVPIRGNRSFNWLISAPTMRVPMHVDRTANAMLAFRAVLDLALREGIASVSCPGLGTGEGRMPPTRCARQMRYAWRVVREGHRERLGGLAGAVRNHLALLEEE